MRTVIIIMQALDRNIIIAYNNHAEVDPQVPTQKVEK